MKALQMRESRGHELSFLGVGLALLGCLLAACAASLSAPVADAGRANPPGDQERLRDVLHVIDGGALTLLDAFEGTRLTTLPLGVFSPDGSTTYVTSQDGSTTTLRALDLATGETRAETTLEGRFLFPEVVGGPATVLGGIDPSGQWLVLESHTSSGLVSGRLTYDSVFAVLGSALTEEPQILPLEGEFAFDGISENGRWLYLIESRSSSEPLYRVRAYDMAMETLLEEAIVDKSEPDEPMVGFRHAVAASPDGTWLYSLYLNPGVGAFVHALNVTEHTAICIDLPPGQVSDELSDFSWSMAVSHDGRSLYAVNSMYRLATEIDLQDFRVVKIRPIELAAISRPSAVSGALETWFGAAVAEAKGETSGTALLSPDGQTLYVPGDGMVLALDTADLTLIGMWMQGRPISSLGISRDGRSLYVVTLDSPRIALVDTATGAVLRYVDGAREPWAIVGVTSR
jgi:hypothetical protein